MQLEVVGVNLRVCERCRSKKHGLPPCGGPEANNCPCPEDGAPITSHAESGDCPIGRFPKPKGAAPVTALAQEWTLFAKLANGARGALKAAVGVDYAGDEEVDRRNGICAGCPFAKMKLGVVKVCDKCGCLISLKIRVKGQKCPIGKW